VKSIVASQERADNAAHCGKWPIIAGIVGEANRPVIDDTDKAPRVAAMLIIRRAPCTCCDDVCRIRLRERAPQARIDFGPKAPARLTFRIVCKMPP
jgi:hypothetical protein